MARNGVRAHYVIEDAMEHLYDVTVFGKTILTTVTKNPKAVAEWIREVQPDGAAVHRYIGLDLKHANDAISTVHLCVGRRCLVIQLLRLLADGDDYPPSLGEFFQDANNIFVGMDVEFKLGLLYGVLCIIEDPVRFRDVGILAAQRYRDPELCKASREALVWKALGMELEMPRHFESDWDRTGKLSDAQVKYACVEAFVSFELGRWLIRDDEDN